MCVRLCFRTALVILDYKERPNPGIVLVHRPQDVGKSKAIVAAERVMERVKGVTVIPHDCMIQDKGLDFYEQFHVIVLGLDSLEARRYMNSVACSFLGTVKII